MNLRWCLRGAWLLDPAAALQEKAGEMGRLELSPQRCWARGVPLTRVRSERRPGNFNTQSRRAAEPSEEDAVIFVYIASLLVWVLISHRFGKMFTPGTAILAVQL